MKTGCLCSSSWLSGIILLNELNIREKRTAHQRDEDEEKGQKDCRTTEEQNVSARFGRRYVVSVLDERWPWEVAAGVPEGMNRNKQFNH